MLLRTESRAFYTKTFDNILDTQRTLLKPGTKVLIFTRTLHVAAVWRVFPLGDSGSAEGCGSDNMPATIPTVALRWVQPLKSSYQG